MYEEDREGSLLIVSYMEKYQLVNNTAGLEKEKQLGNGQWVVIKTDVPGGMGGYIVYRFIIETGKYIFQAVISVV
jgi:hypothetical protein